jgi:hypothetical protein
LAVEVEAEAIVATMVPILQEAQEVQVVTLEIV